MGFSAKVLADSITENGNRLTTIEVTFPRMVLAEFNTHRVFSRNSASSRAIPFKTQLKRILDDPFIPIYWGVNQPGMQATTELDKKEQGQAVNLWLNSRDLAVLMAVQLGGGVKELDDKDLEKRIIGLQKKHVATAKVLGAPLKRGIHKQIINRILEPYMWHTVIVTATEWENFWALRVSPMAQPEINRAAELMFTEYSKSSPILHTGSGWHLPLIQDDELVWANANPEIARKVSAGRCARVSYLTHDGKRDYDKDIELCEILMSNGHMSPLEHVARPMTDQEYAQSKFSGNFKGWLQYRKEIANESNFALVLKNMK